MRGMGVVMLAHACTHMVTRSIPYGWEGREPSGYITGIPAVLLGLFMAIIGIAMLAVPDFMLVLFGWDIE